MSGGMIVVGEDEEGIVIAWEQDEIEVLRCEVSLRRGRTRACVM